MEYCSSQVIHSDLELDLVTKEFVKYCGYEIIIQEYQWESNQHYSCKPEETRHYGDG